jgi:hypothetical protein
MVTGTDTAANQYDPSFETWAAGKPKSDCDDLKKVCITRQIVNPATGDSAAEIAAIVASYAASYYAVSATYISSTATAAKYTVSLFGKLLPIAVGTDVVVNGECQ